MPPPVRPRRWQTPALHSRRDCARASTLSPSTVSLDQLHPRRAGGAARSRTGAANVVRTCVYGTEGIVSVGGFRVIIAVPGAVCEKKELSIADHVRVSRVDWIHDWHWNQPASIVNCC